MDLGAERLMIAAERDERRIAVEVASFLGLVDKRSTISTTTPQLCPGQVWRPMVQ